MCIGPFAPKVQTANAPPTPPRPIAVPQNIVSTAGTDRSRDRRRTAISGGAGQNRTLLSGSLVSPPTSGTSLLG